MIQFPQPCWVELRMPISKKLIARFDPIRGILEVQERCEKEAFDLAQMVQEHRKQEMIQMRETTER